MLLINFYFSLSISGFVIKVFIYWWIIDFCNIICSVKWAANLNNVMFLFHSTIDSSLIRRQKKIQTSVICTRPDLKDVKFFLYLSVSNIKAEKTFYVALEKLNVNLASESVLLSFAFPPKDACSNPSFCKIWWCK